MSYDPQENSTSASPLPFLVVLAGIMGSLLLTLVLLTRMTRTEAAQQAVEAEQIAEEVKVREQNAQANQRLDKVQTYVAELDEVRSEASRNLHQDELKLTQIDEEIQRLNQKLDELRRIAAELNTHEESLFGDREKVRSEAVRLQELVQVTQTQINQLRSEKTKAIRSYVVVPRKGRNGAPRPTIYIECAGDEAILQPEGIRLTKEDFIAPLGPSNPLAVALRAAREYAIRENPVIATDPSLAPYPLILIRPDGEQTFDKVCAAIQTWESDYGYEPVGADWKLQFPEPNPHLGAIEQQVIDQARARQRALANMAPRPTTATGTPISRSWPSPPVVSPNGMGENLAPRNELNEGRVAIEPGYAPAPQPSPPSPPGPILFGSEQNDETARHWKLPSEFQGASADGDVAGSEDASGEPGGEFTPIGRVRPLSKMNGSAVRKALEKLTQPFGVQSTDETETAEAISQELDGLSDPPAIASSGDADVGNDDESDLASNGTTQPPSPDLHQDASNDENAQLALGNLIPGKRRDAIPIRRNIHVVVTDEYLTILGDGEGRDGSADRKIRFDDTTSRVNAKFTSALSGHMKEWGSAGHGMYWRPIMMLDVMPGGEEYAQHLSGAIKNSGLETRLISTSMTQRENEPTTTYTR